MEKKAVITVKSNSSANEEDLIEVVTPGTFYITEDGFRAEYDESKLSGMEGTHTTILIRDKSFDLIREGSTETKMEFEAREIKSSLYKTPYGVLEIDIDTIELEMNIDENGGSIHTVYTLAIEGQDPIKTELNINIRVSENN